MKLPIGLFTVVALIAIALFYYNQPEPSTPLDSVKKETQDLLEAISNYTADKKDDAIQEAKQGLANIDKRIETLEASIDDKWDKMSETARSEARENIEALHDRRDQVAQWYDRLETSSVNSWEHIKTGFSESYQALENSWNKAEQEFKDEQ